MLRSRLRSGVVQTFRLDKIDADADLGRALADYLRQSDGRVTYVTGWAQAFAGPDGAERLYRFNLLRETIFAANAVQIWWMPEVFRDAFMLHAPDTWSFMSMRLSLADADEYLELPPTLARLVRAELKLHSFAPIPTAAATRLRRLSAAFEKLQDEDVFALSALKGLHELWLFGVGVTDVAPLAALIRLRKLQLSRTRVTSIAPIAALKSLKYLSFVSTPISDISSLSQLVNLEELHLERTLVKEVSPIAKLPSLKKLSLFDTWVNDLAILAEHPTLMRVQLPDGEIWNPQENPPPWF